MAEEAKKDDKKTILITGSSTGIGKETAKLFQKKGWNVIATMRTPSKETELNKLDNVLVTRLDVIDSKSITNAIEEGIKKFGKIDVFVNNAGYGCMGIVEAVSMEKIRKQYDVNVFGLIDCIKQITPIFRKQKSGIIINISSAGGKVVFPTATIYNSTKFAVEGISEGLWYELQPLGISVKVVEPGAFKTQFGSTMDFSNDEKLVEYQPMIASLNKLMEKMIANAGEPSDVANVIYKAATDGTDQLRYVAGKDAEQFLANRKKLSDKEFFDGIKKQTGLSE